MTATKLQHPLTEVSWTAIAVSGNDARTYLQGQLSCDVVGNASMGLLLHPSGEVLTDVDLSYGEQRIVLTLRSELQEAALSRLRRFVLRSDVQMEIVQPTTFPYRTVSEQIERGRPGPNEFAPLLAPQAFGQTFVGSRVSFTKGCFTGQELVGRLDARGANVPFHLARCSGVDIETATIAIESFGPSGDRMVQGITTACLGDHGFSALAIIHRSYENSDPTMTTEVVA